MRTHYLKCWPEFFAALQDGTKTFEVRKDDRGYAVGERLVVALFDPVTDKFMERRRELSDLERAAQVTDVRYVDECVTLSFTITYKLPGGRFGIAPEYCVLGLKPCL